jgi:NNP family nitrate/nitrite transporter-like MFS transporter
MTAALALGAAAVAHNLYFNVAMLLVASGALGMANGSVFQLLPQRFGKDIGVMTGLVGAGGGVGGFYLASSLGLSKGLTGSYLAGFCVFAGLCLLAIVGLSMVKMRWRTTWGAVANARI